MSDSEPRPLDSRGPTTLWTQVILACRDKDEKVALEALKNFCLQYREVIHDYFRSRGCKPTDAEDYTARFFETRILELWDDRDGFLFTVERRESAKFRGFLKGVLWNFLRDEWTAERAQKRGGGAVFIPIDGADFLEGELPENPAPTFSCQFDRVMALRIIKMAAARSKYSRHVILHFRDEMTQDHAARELGITPGAFKLAYFRFRKNLREDLEREVRKLVGPDKNEIRKEIEYLITLFSESTA